jgi:hypothetical protein
MRALAALVVVIAFATAGVYWQFLREVAPAQNCAETSTSSSSNASVPCP